MRDSLITTKSGLQLLIHLQSINPIPLSSTRVGAQTCNGRSLEVPTTGRFTCRGIVHSPLRTDYWSHPQIWHMFFLVVYCRLAELNRLDWLVFSVAFSTHAQTIIIIISLLLEAAALCWVLRGRCCYVPYRYSEHPPLGEDVWSQPLVPVITFSRSTPNSHDRIRG